MDTRRKLVELLINTIGLTPTDAEIYANDFIAHGITLQEWIPVEDRLPDVGFDVLFMCENKCCCVGTYSDTYRDFFSGQFPVKGVTHWMPLPKPLKGE